MQGRALARRETFFCSCAEIRTTGTYNSLIIFIKAIMPSYKFTYFNGRGRAETARIIFAQAGVKYEDVRVNEEEFSKIKPTLPAGSLPVLEVDGVQLAGSRSIVRFLGERFGLAGSNDMENAQIDSIIDVLTDLAQKCSPVFEGYDEAKKAEAKKALFGEYVPKYFGIIEKRITANNSPDGWVFGKKLTYADIRIATGVEMVAVLQPQPSITDSYPAIKKLTDAVNAQPKIAEWIKNRPVTFW